MGSLVRAQAGEQEKSRRHHCLRGFLFLDLSLSFLKKDLYGHLYRVKLVHDSGKFCQSVLFFQGFNGNSRLELCGKLSSCSFHRFKFK
jgi:hypothetical protein